MSDTEVWRQESGLFMLVVLTGIVPKEVRPSRCGKGGFCEVAKQKYRNKMAWHWHWFWQCASCDQQCILVICCFLEPGVTETELNWRLLGLQKNWNWSILVFTLLGNQHHLISLREHFLLKYVCAGEGRPSGFESPPRIKPGSSVLYCENLGKSLCSALSTGNWR